VQVVMRRTQILVFLINKKLASLIEFFPVECAGTHGGMARLSWRSWLVNPNGLYNCEVRTQQFTKLVETIIYTSSYAENGQRVHKPERNCFGLPRLIWVSQIKRSFFRRSKACFREIW